MGMFRLRWIRNFRKIGKYNIKTHGRVWFFRGLRRKTDVFVAPHISMLTWYCMRRIIRIFDLYPQFRLWTSKCCYSRSLDLDVHHVQLTHLFNITSCFRFRVAICFLILFSVLYDAIDVWGFTAFTNTKFGWNQQNSPISAEILAILLDVPEMKSSVIAVLFKLRLRKTLMVITK